jgi:hypothetical protein
VILARHPEGVLLVHGACPRGADAIAADYASRTPGYRMEAHPADWQRHGRAAGQFRNATMIALGSDGCIAFLRGAAPRPPCGWLGQRVYPSGSAPSRRRTRVRARTPCLTFGSVPTPKGKG